MDRAEGGCGNISRYVTRLDPDIEELQAIVRP
jgi:hypothetical protein